MGKLAAYSSCKRLLLKVDLIIKDSNGNIILEKRLDKLSEVFSIENREIIK
jgi:hypothetical protein